MRRQRLLRIFIAVIISAFSFVVAYFGFLATYSSMLKGLHQHSTNPSTISSTEVTILAGILGIVGVGASLVTYFKSKHESTNPAKPTATTASTSGRFHLQAAEETSDELLSVERERLELEKQKIQLEREQQSLGWQKEALAVVEVSPRAAILIAWIGVEQAIEYARNTLGLRDIDSARQRSPNLIISILKDKGLIDSNTASILKDMQKLRNQVVHGQADKEITYEAALDYVQQAILVTNKLSSKESDIVAVRLKMTDGTEATFQEWLTEPDKLKQYIDVFSQPNSSIKPLQAIFVMRNGRQIVVDVSTGAEQNIQLDELLSYLKQTAFLQ